MIKKIYLYSPSQNLHTIYQEIVNHPPKGYSYIFEQKNLSLEKLNKLKAYKEKSNLLKIISKFISPITVMEILSFFRKLPIEAKFVHATNNLFIKNSPWVGDLECIGSYLGHSEKMSYFKKRYIGSILSRKSCKKIMPFTEYGKNTIIKALDTKKFLNKIEVVHFASYVPKPKNKKEDGKIRLLFVGSANHQNSLALYSKGAKEVLEAFKYLSKKYPKLELTMLTKLPEDIDINIKNLKVLFVDRNETQKIYEKSDIFLFPTFLFPGMSLVEAMGNGLPIITTRLYGNPEFVENGKTGFLIDLPHMPQDEYGSVPINKFKEHISWMSKNNGETIVQELIKKIEILINNKSLLKNMKINSRKKYEKEFSIEARNSKLKKIYDSIAT